MGRRRGRRHGRPLSAQEIRAAVRERDGYRCVQCGLTNDDHIRIHGAALQVHRKIPGGQYAVDDTCETLCIPCHGPKPRRRRGVGPQRFIIPEEIAYKIRILSTHSECKPSDYAARILKPVVDKEFSHFIEVELAKLASREEPPE